MCSAGSPRAWPGHEALFSHSMRHPQPLRTERIELRNLEPAEVTSRYVDWLNDAAVNRFLEVRFATHT